MSFLSAAFLLALPLALTPVLLHLFDRRRNVVIEWGAMQFLAEAAARRTRARRFQQWMLLLLRVLAMACLVFALARPMAPGLSLGERQRTETVFILDSSMSMQRGAGETMLFDAAVERLLQTLAECEPGGFARVLRTSPYPVWETPAAVRIDPAALEGLRAQVKQVQCTLARSDLLTALFTAVQADLEPSATERRLVLITDGQQADWDFDDVDAWRQLRELFQSSASPLRFEVVTLSDGADRGNLAVNRLQAPRTVIGIDQPISITAEVQNHGEQAAPPCDVTWSAGDEVIDRTTVTALEAAAVQEIVCSHSFSKPGVYAVGCGVDAADGLAADNREVLIVEVVDQLPVLVIESAAQHAEFQQDAFFLLAALGWSDGERLDEGSMFAPTLASPDDLERIELSQYRALVIPNWSNVSDTALERLEDYVANGGGLWLALGPRTDVEHFNHALFADGQGLAALALTGIVDEPAEPQPTRIDPLSARHAANFALADAQRLDTGQVTVERRFRFAAAEDASVLLRLTNGEPLAVEKVFGRGRVIETAVPLRLQWSDLAKSQAFVVMVQDWLTYLAQSQMTRHNLAPGDPLLVRMSADAPREATLHMPQGEIAITADAAAEVVEFRSSRTLLPGDYAMEVGLSGEALPFHVRRDPVESNLAPVNAADRERIAALTELHTSHPVQTASTAAASDPLWPLLWIALLAIITVELVLSGIISRQRFGVQTLLETAEHSQPLTDWHAAPAKKPLVAGERAASRHP